MIEKKRPRWESELWATQGVSENIVCKTCMFRIIEVNGKKVDIPTGSCCEIYEYPDGKPHEVYFDGAECEFYEDHI
jgi:hypothetical protein